jgi:hypothetical protein
MLCMLERESQKYEWGNREKEIYKLRVNGREREEKKCLKVFHLRFWRQNFREHHGTVVQGEVAIYYFYLNT